MKFPKTYTLKEIARISETDYIGDDNFPVSGMNEIHVVVNGDIVFVDHPKYYDKALESAASVVIINKKVACPEGKALLISEDPFRDFNKLSIFFNSFRSSDQNIAVNAVIGENTHIQPNVFIGNNVKIGNNCLIHSNVSIYDDCVIGNNVTIHSGTVLGGDAFYYKNRPEGFDKLISIGNVVLEDHVDLGANCTIDRGVTGSTTVGMGSKIDNLVQIGHDSVIGEKCLIASQVGISGCVIIEKEVTIWGQVGVTSKVTIGAKAIVLGQTAVSKSLIGGKVYSGDPVQEARKRFKEIARIRNHLNSIK